MRPAYKTNNVIHEQCHLQYAPGSVSKCLVFGLIYFY